MPYSMLYRITESSSKDRSPSAMDTYAANLSTASERLIQDFVKNLD